MAIRSVRGVRIAGVASAVPSATSTVADAALAFGQEEAERTAKATGVSTRHVVPDGVCSSDLCFAATTKLLSELRWDTSSVNALVFVSQTPDYVLPATSCSLHGRLGLAQDCAAFDISMGCSGYVFGLWVASSLIAAGGAQRVLLLVGDTISRLTAPEDRSVAALFGDAGTATALERAPDESGMIFELGTDGKGAQHLIVPAGGQRQRRTSQTAIRTQRLDGNVRSDEDLEMNGGEVFAFTLSKVPPLVNSLMKAAGWTPETADAFVFHQANRFMLQHLAKKMKLPLDKVPLSLGEYGNTSSASIPLTLSTCMRDRLQHEETKILMAGFGVGFSWAGVAIDSHPMVMPKVVTVDGVDA